MVLHDFGFAFCGCVLGCLLGFALGLIFWWDGLGVGWVSWLCFGCAFYFAGFGFGEWLFWLLQYMFWWFGFRI